MKETCSLKHDRSEKLIILGLILALVLPLLVPAVASRAAIKATAIACNKSVTDQLTKQDKEKTYEFTVDKTGYFNIIFEKKDKLVETKEWKIELLDSNGSKIKSYSTDTKVKSPEFNFKTGTKFYIKVSTSMPSIGPIGIDYILRVNTKANAGWEQEANDTLATATKIVANETGRLGTLWKTGDVDYYKYTVDKTGYFFVRLRKTVASADPKYGWKLTMLDAKGNELRNWSGIESSYVTNKYAFKKGTVLYFKVEGSLPSLQPVDVHYNLIIKSAANASWEVESNDATTSANAVNAGGSKTGNLFSSKDKDCYKFTATKNGSIKVQFKKLDANADVGYGWSLKVTDTNGKELFNQNRVSSNILTKAITVKKGKTYYITVAGGLGASPVDDYYKITVKQY